MNKQRNLVFVIVLFVLIVSAQCQVEEKEKEESCGSDSLEKSERAALSLKIPAIISILIASAIGVCIPILGSEFSLLRPENDFFFIIKAYAAGVILATGLIHILPTSFEKLNSKCLKDNPWGRFPFSGFICMLGIIGTLMTDTFATSYHKNRELKRSQPELDEEMPNGVSNPFDPEEESRSEVIRHRVISQVLELGIVVHSIIIGLAVGTSQSSSTVRPLIVALSFHQFFEGIGLGGCIVQAKFKTLTIALMTMFFSLTTPFGIALGIGLSSTYNENSPTSLIVEGVSDAASAGILIYMSLVDLLANDFMSSRMQSNVKLTLWSYFSLLLGATCMSVLARWA